MEDKKSESSLEGVPKVAADAVLVSSAPLPGYETKVSGYDWGQGKVDYERLLDSYATSGFQATAFGEACNEVSKMIDARRTDILDPYTSESSKGCTIFLGYTSNLISSGLRETFLFLVKNKMVDCIVTTAGGVEEDFIKCLAPTLLGDFGLDGACLREKGINRIGNLLVPNDNYCKFEDWIVPIFNEMLEEQKTNGVVWTPSKMIRKLGQKIDNEESVYYWAWKNNIPVFSPALTDGSIGDMLFFHSFKNPGLLLDIIEDLRSLNTMAMKAHKTGMIILGGGMVKHHICNANLMRNGADYSVFINTAQEFDGSDAGARPDEAVSWGKIKCSSKPVKVYADATLIFPLLVAKTFAKMAL